MVKKYCKRIALVLALCALAAAAGVLVLDRLYPFPLERIDDRLAAGSTLVRAADASLVAWRVDREDNRRLGVELAGVSPWLIEATIAVEDKRFWEHRGVDAVAVGRAFLQNITAGRRVSGASTITMQTIRLLWPRPRTLKSKVKESFRAWQLERLVDKDRILEIYFNLAPYGGNVVGVEAAARRYFGKGAGQLNLAEASLLAGLPQSPARLNPLRHPDSALRRRDFVIGRLLEDGRITAEQAARAWKEKLELAPASSSDVATHFADFILGAAPRSRAEIVTTLDADLQRTVAAAAGRHADALSANGVAGPAVVVLSLADSSILAYVGNASPNTMPSRLIDAARARRQPGSLMKPFIFALLAGKGDLTPSTRVYDLPRTWSGYSPRNMDREWFGEMAASDALRQSRNITAVQQLASLGPDAFVDFMKRIGLDPGQTGRHGLSLALGSKEQTLLDLANAYAALGRLGQWLPYRFSKEAQPSAPTRALSPEAAWLTLSALASAEEERAPRVVWKTGTSWNQLDAWAVAMTPEVVVGVWCGRLARGGSSWAAGSDDALPLALEVLDVAAADRGRAWRPPRGIEFSDVCTESGALPGWHCPETMTSPVLAGNRPGGGCALHTVTAAKAQTDDRTGESSRRVKILSPVQGSIYVDRGESSLPLLAEASGEKELVWFVDGARVGVSETGEVLYWPMRRGNHRLSVGSESGGFDMVEIRVE